MRTDEKILLFTLVTISVIIAVSMYYFIGSYCLGFSGWVTVPLGVIAGLLAPFMPN